MRNYRTSSHKCAFTHSDSAKNDGTAADRGTPTNTSCHHIPIDWSLRLAGLRRGAGIEVIDEHYPVTDENFVLDRDTFTKERVTRDFATGTDRHPSLDFDKSSDTCVVTDLAAIEINEAMQHHVLPQPYVRRNPEKF